jgi:hypothetical protein
MSLAASVGFATQIGKQGWLLDGRLPDAPQLEVVSLLLSSIVVVVASWEGYFEAISSVKLRDRIRFYIDIFIVIAYIILLYATVNQRTWHWTLAAIFLSYFVWDIFTHAASESDWAKFQPHSVCWFLALFGIAILVTYWPFHPFRYTAASLISVLLFRWISPSRNFVKHLALAVVLATLCFVTRNCYLS